MADADRGERRRAGILVESRSIVLLCRQGRQVGQRRPGKSAAALTRRAERRNDRSDELSLRRDVRAAARCAA